MPLLDVAPTRLTAAEWLRRHPAEDFETTLGQSLTECKRWLVESVELPESDLSYPRLAYYRSQHERQWRVEALTTKTRFARSVRFWTSAR